MIDMLAAVIISLFAWAIIVLGAVILIAWAVLNPWWTIGIVGATVVAALVRDAIEVKKRATS